MTAVELFGRDQRLDLIAARRALQVRRQGLHIGHMAAQENGLDRIHAIGVIDQGEYLARVAARVVGHGAPQGARFPPAVVGAGIAEAGQHHQRRTEQRQGHRGEVPAWTHQQHVIHGDEDIPEQQPEQRPANIGESFDQVLAFSDKGVRHGRISTRGVTGIRPSNDSSISLQPHESRVIRWMGLLMINHLSASRMPSATYASTREPEPVPIGK